MSARALTIGTLLYAALVGVLVPVWGGVPYQYFFTNDAFHYSQGAINLLTQGLYSIDGIHAFLEREPGMSFFLAVTYGLFGIENIFALLLVQIVALYIAAALLAKELYRWYGQTIAAVSFALILTSGSIAHALFTANREALTTILTMLIVTLFLRAVRTRRLMHWLILAIPLAYAVLTYFPILLLPFGIAVLFSVRPGYRVGVMITLFVMSGLVSLWALRNATIDGNFRVIANQRTAVMWYVRGEQAERVHGLEPLRCLYAEYVTRNWNGRSDACSFNGLMHRKWPDGFDYSLDMSDIAKSGQAKIMQNISSYLNFSLFEIVELHIPFVGGGMSRLFNVYAALTHLLLFIGCAIGLCTLRREYRWLWLMPIAYNIAVYILTDATPRYLVPFLPLYAVLAAFGYDVLLRRFRPNP
ncbi:MAG: glycosyltransferase family 39 protein [Candidatus Peribacteraceae bacterium]